MRGITAGFIVAMGLMLGAGVQDAAAQSGTAEKGQSSAAAQSSEQDSSKESSGEKSSGDKLTIELCDGKTTVTVDADIPRTPENGRKIADALMAQWRRAHPNAKWVMEETEKHKIKRPADNSDLIGQGQVGTYSNVTAADVALWDQETFKLVAEGSRIFHSPTELGSDIGVSCDTCHPDAANTHPETYPKYQVQLGRVALLRDMINWCIIHPVHGKMLDPDGHKMRALEAYILAQRKGVPLNYGKR